MLGLKKTKMAPENSKSTYFIGLLGLDSNNTGGAVNMMPVTQSALKMLPLTMIMMMRTWLLPSPSSQSSGGRLQVNT